LCSNTKDKRFNILAKKIVFLVEAHEFQSYTDHVKADLYCYDIGTFYLLRRELEKAIVCYDKAIELVPYHEAWNNKGLAYYLKKEYDKAVSCFDKHLIDSPNDILGYVNKSTALIALKRFSDGLESCSTGLDIEPMNPDLWNSKGICYHYLNRTAEALGCFDKALQINKNYFKAWHSKGFTYYQLNK
jgi:tetratricopeptide (TPR) repeat protein